MRKKKKIINVEKYTGEFNVEYNEPHTYFLVYEDGSKRAVSKQEADYQLGILQNRKEFPTKQQQFIERSILEKPGPKTLEAIKNSLENPNNMKVNVLGTEYDVELVDGQDEAMKELNCVGYTDKSTKKIKVKLFKNETIADDEKPEVNTNNTLRHELIHAFLFECGIEFGNQFHNEECVTFFALQFPKLAKIFDDAGCKE